MIFLWLSSGFPTVWGTPFKRLKSRMDPRAIHLHRRRRGPVRSPLSAFVAQNIDPQKHPETYVY